MKVLIADDEILIRGLLEKSLRQWGYEVVVARDGIEAARILEAADAPQLVLLDWLMPGLDGLELCRRVRAHDRERYTYIVILTAKCNKDDLVNGFEAGADDYIIKPFDAQELQLRLRTGERILRLQTQLIQARDELRNQGMRDPLTRLWNCNAILDILGQELDQARRQQTSVGVILLDLDYFKRVNDTYGHLIGNTVLCELAGVMVNATRPYDAVGRQGGEEFLIVLPGCDQHGALSQAEQMRMTISRMTVNTDAGPVRMTASLGVAVAGPSEVTDITALLREADDAMYRAKRRGRNCIESSNASGSGLLLAAHDG
ncbi:MAG TPA: diguanylate cyclase [Pirellulales bacterium]|jgi:diguanylate cyclase (GGDEF)-like protein|nr:diguanylate cyclase [Pirellulales bacterium]